MEQVLKGKAPEPGGARGPAVPENNKVAAPAAKVAGNEPAAAAVADKDADRDAEAIAENPSTGPALNRLFFNRPLVGCLGVRGRPMYADRQSETYASLTDEARRKRPHLKIAVLLKGGKSGARLGTCDEFAVFEVDKQSNRTLYEAIHHAPNEASSLPCRLHELGTDVVLAGETEENIRQLFTDKGIAVLLDLTCKRPEQVLADYLCGAVMPDSGGAPT